MKKKIAFAMLLAVAAWAHGAEYTVTLFGTGLVPVGDFSDDDDIRYDGFAAPGFGITGQFAVEGLGHPSVAWVSDVSLLINFMNLEEAEDNDPLLMLATDLEGGTFFSMPFLTGIRFSVPMPDVKMYLAAQAGVNILTESDVEGSMRFGRSRGELSFDNPSFGFAFSVGGGVVLRDLVDLGLCFANLGTQQYDYSGTAWGVTSDGEREFAIEQIQFMIGYRF